MPDLMTTFKFALSVDNVNIGYFRKCAGIESETEIIEFKEATEGGRMIIRKVPGAMKWGDITLDRRIDSSKALWEWRKQVIDGDADSARRHGSIIAYDSDRGRGGPLELRVRLAVEVEGGRLRRQRERGGDREHHDHP